jgi:hypothetical protein
VKKIIVCSQCEKRFYNKNKCPDCGHQVNKGNNKAVVIILKGLIFITLSFAFVVSFNNYRFISNTEEVIGKVIKTGSEQISNRRRSDSTRYTATIEYNQHDGHVRQIYINPVFVNIEWFSYGEIVTVRYSKDNLYPAQPSNFLYFWNTVWMSLIMAFVYYLILKIIPRNNE